MTLFVVRICFGGLLWGLLWGMLWGLALGCALGSASGCASGCASGFALGFSLGVCCGRLLRLFSVGVDYQDGAFEKFALWIWICCLKFGSLEKIPFWCRCSILLGPTFEEIKKSYTKTLLTLNSKNFKIICYWKKFDESAAI